MKRLVLLLGAMVLSSSAFAAGIDPREYTCAGLHALVGTHGFVFISQPFFGDFVVSDVSYCGGAGSGGVIQLRSVPTQDNPQCVVNYCVSRSPSTTRQ